MWWVVDRHQHVYSVEKAGLPKLLATAEFLLFNC